MLEERKSLSARLNWRWACRCTYTSLPSTLHLSLPPYYTPPIPPSSLLLCACTVVIELPSDTTNTTHILIQRLPHPTYADPTFTLILLPLYLVRVALTAYTW